MAKASNSAVIDTSSGWSSHCGGNGTEVREGAFTTSALPIAGFAIIEAESLEEAVRMVGKTPCAVAHGVVEVWPLQS